MRYLYIALLATGLISCSSIKQKISFANNVVIAHRGAWKASGLPENSIAALKKAIQLECAGSEFDIHMTADDSLIVNHDPHYNNLLIEETTYEKLIQTPLFNGEKLPTLYEYIKAGLENNYTTRLVCEIKPSSSRERELHITEKVIEMIAKQNARPMTVYISFSYDVLKKIEEIDPNAHTQYLAGDKSPEELKKDGIDGADYYFTEFIEKPEWVTSAKSNNIALNAWTVNIDADIEWLLNENFDFITTNEPELVLKMQKK